MVDDQLQKKSIINYFEDGGSHFYKFDFILPLKNNKKKVILRIKRIKLWEGN